MLEILKSTLRTREYVEQGESDGKTLLDAMRDGSQDGMQHFDGEIEKLIRARHHHARHRHELRDQPEQPAAADRGHPRPPSGPPTPWGRPLGRRARVTRLRPD